jgi:hypothetical protein
MFRSVLRDQASQDLITTSIPPSIDRPFPLRTRITRVVAAPARSSNLTFGKPYIPPFVLCELNIPVVIKINPQSCYKQCTSDLQRTIYSTWINIHHTGDPSFSFHDIYMIMIHVTYIIPPRWKIPDSFPKVLDRYSLRSL